MTKYQHRAEIVDYKLAALRVMEHPGVMLAVRDAVDQLVKAANGKVDIPGVKIITEVKQAS